MIEPGTSDASTGWSSSLISTLEDQGRLLDELAPLAERQAELVKSGDTEALFGLLAQRQRIIERLAGEQERLASLTGDHDQLHALDDDRRARIRRLIARIGEGLARIMEGDARDQRVLASARQRISNEITTVSTARHARDAYRNDAAVAPRFADRKG